MPTRQLGTQPLVHASTYACDVCEGARVSKRVRVSKYACMRAYIPTRANTCGEHKNESTHKTKPKSEHWTILALLAPVVLASTILLGTAVTGRAVELALAVATALAATTATALATTTATTAAGACLLLGGSGRGLHLLHAHTGFI